MPLCREATGASLCVVDEFEMEILAGWKFWLGSQLLLIDRSRHLDLWRRDFTTLPDPSDRYLVYHNIVAD